MISIKNKTQIEGIRESCKMLSEVMKVLKESVEPGISTMQLDDIARREISARGGKPAFLGYMDFPAAICASVNEVVIHGIPNEQPLKKGDIVSIDCGIDYNGFFSDAAITVAVGEVSSSVEQLLKVTEESLYRGIDAAKPGGRINDISRAVYTHAKRHGFGVVREFCGHGVGLAPHEEPQVPNYVGRGPNPKLIPGMVLAIEPMFTMGSDYVKVLGDGWSVVPMDNSLSAHFEHTIVILEDRVEILTL